MADVEDDKDVNTQSASDMGFGARDMGDVNVGAAYDADRGGLGSGTGLTEAKGDFGGWDLGGQVSRGEADAWGPSFGTPSHIGGAVGTVLGMLTGTPGLGMLGAYGPGAINSMFGRGGTPGLPDIGGKPNSISAVGSGGGGGLLGLGNDTNQADALAALYALLKAKQGVQ